MLAKKIQQLRREALELQKSLLAWSLLLVNIAVGTLFAVALTKLGATKLLFLVSLGSSFCWPLVFGCVAAIEEPETRVRLRLVVASLVVSTGIGNVIIHGFWEIVTPGG